MAVPFSAGVLSLVSTANTVALLESPMNRMPLGPKARALMDLISGVPLVTGLGDIATKPAAANSKNRREKRFFIAGFL